MSTNHFDFVAQLAQSLDRAGGDALFEIDGSVHDIARIRHARADANSRRVESRLGRVAKDELVEEDLHVSLRLHEAAHDAVDAVQALI